jgi:hypothetical protein
MPSLVLYSYYTHYAQKHFTVLIIAMVNFLHSLPIYVSGSYIESAFNSQIIFSSKLCQLPSKSFFCILYIKKNKVYARLWLSWGSMLPLSTQVHKFKPSRSRQDFSGQKILSTPSFGGEVKPSIPWHRFAACKRSLNETWKLTFRQNYQPTFSPTVPPSAARISCIVWTWRHLAAEVGTSKNHGGTRVAQ